MFLAQELPRGLLYHHRCVWSFYEEKEGHHLHFFCLKTRHRILRARPPVKMFFFSLNDHKKYFNDDFFLILGTKKEGKG